MTNIKIIIVYLHLVIHTLNTLNYFIKNEFIYTYNIWQEEWCVLSNSERNLSECYYIGIHTCIDTLGIVCFPVYMLPICYHTFYVIIVAMYVVAAVTVSMWKLGVWLRSACKLFTVISASPHVHRYLTFVVIAFIFYSFVRHMPEDVRVGMNFNLHRLGVVIK